MRFNIDPQTRAIDNNYSKLGTQGENKVEVVEFVAPKMFGLVDLSTVDVRCLLNATLSSGSTLLKELPITVDDETVVAKWEVGLEETAEVGYLKIALHFSTAFDNRLRTLPTTFEVMETITVESYQPVLFSTRKARMASFEAPIGFAVEPEIEVISVLENKLIIPAKLQNIAVQNDNESKKVKIVMPRYYQTEDLSKHAIRLHIVTSGGDGRVPFVPELTQTEMTLIWTLERPYTSYSGAIQIQLEIGDQTTDTFFKSTESATLNILTALSGEPIAPVSPPEFLEYLKLMEAVKQDAVAAKDISVTKAAEASISASSAAKSSTNAASSATNAKVSEENAKKSETGAAGSLTDIETGLAGKLSISEANQLFRDVSIDDETGIFTFTKYDGTKIIIDTGLEKVVLNMRIDPDTLELVLRLADGTEQRVSLVPFLNLYTGGQTETVDVQVNGTVISGFIKGNSIHLNLLTPELQAIINNKVTANQTGNASQVKFSDGKSMQEKLDAGDLNGKDGITVEQSGLFYMRVDEFGHLKVGVPDNVQPPPLSIRDGRLIYTIS